MRSPNPIREALGQEIDALKQRNAELFKALRDLVERVDINGGLGEYKRGSPFVRHAPVVTARAISATGSRDHEPQRS